MTTPKDEAAQMTAMNRRRRRQLETFPQERGALGPYPFAGLASFDQFREAMEARTTIAKYGGRLDVAASVFQHEIESLVGSSAAHAKMVRAYAPVYTRLQSDTKSLMAIAQQRQLKPWEIGRMERFKQLETQFLAGASRFARRANDLVTQAQLQAIGLSGDAAEMSFYGSRFYIPTTPDAVVATTFNRLPEEALTALVGYAGDGTPLSELFERLGPATAPKIRETLYQGVALGYSPAKTARLMREATGLPLTRAMTIARTETLRAFREGTRRNYVNNRHLIHSYERHAARSDRTCMACIALDGTLYPVYEPFPSHPNCRCVLLPVPLAPDELRLDFPRESMEEFPLRVGPRTERPPSARDWFAAQPDARQIKMMGRRKWESYKAGSLELSDLGAYRFSDDWGRTVGLPTIAELNANGLLLSHIPGRIHLATEVRRLIDPESEIEISGTLTMPPSLDNIDELEEVLIRRGHPSPGIIRELYARGDAPTHQTRLIPLRAVTHRNRRKQDYVLQFEDYDEWVRQQNLDVLLADEPYRQALDIERQILATDMLVSEQEAWARAMRLSKEVSYYGLSPQAARELNISLYRTIGKNKWRPFKVVTTTDRSDVLISKDDIKGITPKNHVMAYQGDDYMVINSDMIPDGDVSRWNTAMGNMALVNAKKRNAFYGQRADPVLIRAHLAEDPRFIAIQEQIDQLKLERSNLFDEGDAFVALQKRVENYKSYLVSGGRNGYDLPDGVEAQLMNDYLDLDEIPGDLRLRELPEAKQLALLDNVSTNIQRDRVQTRDYIDEINEQLDGLDDAVNQVRDKINDGLVGVKTEKELIEQYRHNTGESFQLDDAYDVTMFQNTVEHEIGHYIHRRYDIDDPLALKIFADGNIPGDPQGWGCKHLHTEGKGISLYGDSNHAEYFAESFSEYLHIPNSPNIPPQMRRYIQNVMDANTLYADEPMYEAFLSARINRETLMQGMSLPMREKYATSLQNAILKVQGGAPGPLDVVPVFVPGPAGVVARRATRIRGVMRLFRAEALKAGVVEGTYELAETEEGQSAIEQIARAEAYWTLTTEVPRALRVPRLLR